MSCECRRGSTCDQHLEEADLSLPTYPAPAFYEERIRHLAGAVGSLRLENSALRDEIADLREQLAMRDSGETV